jgi:hypothetical protein
MGRRRGKEINAFINSFIKVFTDFTKIPCNLLMCEASQGQARILLQCYQTHACNHASLDRSQQCLRNDFVPPVIIKITVFRIKIS